MSVSDSKSLTNPIESIENSEEVHDTVPPLESTLAPFLEKPRILGETASAPTDPEITAVPSDNEEVPISPEEKPISNDILPTPEFSNSASASVPREVSEPRETLPFEDRPSTIAPLNPIEEEPNENPTTALAVATMGSGIGVNLGGREPLPRRPRVQIVDSPVSSSMPIAVFDKASFDISKPPVRPAHVAPSATGLSMPVTVTHPQPNAATHVVPSAASPVVTSTSPSPQVLDASPLSLPSANLKASFSFTVQDSIPPGGPAGLPRQAPPDPAPAPSTSTSSSSYEYYEEWVEEEMEEDDDWSYFSASENDSEPMIDIIEGSTKGDNVIFTLLFGAHPVENTEPYANEEMAGSPSNAASESEEAGPTSSHSSFASSDSDEESNAPSVEAGSESSEKEDQLLQRASEPYGDCLNEGFTSHEPFRDPPTPPTTSQSKREPGKPSPETATSHPSPVDDAAMVIYAGDPGEVGHNPDSLLHLGNREENVVLPLRPATSLAARTSWSSRSSRESRGFSFSRFFGTLCSCGSANDVAPPRPSPNNALVAGIPIEYGPNPAPFTSLVASDGPPQPPPSQCTSHEVTEAHPSSHVLSIPSVHGSEPALALVETNQPPSAAPLAPLQPSEESKKRELSFSFQDAPTSESHPTPKRRPSTASPSQSKCEEMESKGSPNSTSNLIMLPALLESSDIPSKEADQARKKRRKQRKKTSATKKDILPPVKEIEVDSKDEKKLE